MHRVRAFVLAGVVLGSFGASTAVAQTTSTNGGPWSVQGDVAATFGHTSSASFGAEAGYDLGHDWQAFVEGGRMQDVAPSSLDARAKIVADAIGGTASMKERALYGTVGLRYNLMPAGGWQPFVLAGVGVARLTAVPAFSVGGSDVTSALASTYHVQLGTDLDGHVTKAMFTLGGGVHVPFKDNMFTEASLRYGGILARKAVIPGDKAVNTFRLQVGIGIRF